MRLINVKTYDLEFFFTTNLPKFAILSHRWGSEKDEPTYKDWIKGRKHDAPGYRKVIEFCSLAEDEGYEYAWSDTVCIDKTSSSELNEAINSMFDWYQLSDICIAFLSDVDGLDDIATSSWFTRGWTLQELLAPANVAFYNRLWRSIGTKSSLKESLSSITRVPAQILEDPQCIRRASIAQRMSFAATRRCTRIEDEAYCLLGIFNVQMPLLYGEGNRAFMRLQQLILEQSDDESIFAWTSNGAKETSPYSLLARSAANFLTSGQVVRVSSSNQYDRPPWRMTNKGIEFWALAETWSPIGRSNSSNSFTSTSRRKSRNGTIHITPLACAEADAVSVTAILKNSVVSKSGSVKPCSVALLKSQDGNVYERVNVETLGDGLDNLYPKPQRHKALEKRFYVRRLEYAATYMSMSAESSFISRTNTDRSEDT